MRRFLVALAAAVAALGLLPPVASAHGLVGRADLPIPTWLFGWAAAIVLGLLLGIAIVAVFVFAFSGETVDAPSLDEGGAKTQQQAREP